MTNAERAKTGAMILTITKKYFDLIASGEKKVEYRKAIDYYARLFEKRPAVITFHYRRGAYLRCTVEKIRLIKRPVRLKKSVFITTKKCYAIHIAKAEVFNTKGK